MSLIDIFHFSAFKIVCPFQKRVFCTKKRVHCIIVKKTNIFDAGMVVFLDAINVYVMTSNNSDFTVGLASGSLKAEPKECLPG